MQDIFHIKIKKEFAASLIEYLIDEDAIEKIEEKDNTRIYFILPNLSTSQ